MVGRARLPFGLAFRQLRVGQLYVKCPDIGVDFDDVAVPQQCDRPAYGGFRPPPPPVTVIGLSAGRTTSWCGFHLTLLRFSAIVRPVTVRQSPCKWPLSSSVFIRSGMPPTSNMSLAT